MSETVEHSEDKPAETKLLVSQLVLASLGLLAAVTGVVVVVATPTAEATAQQLAAESTPYRLRFPWQPQTNDNLVDREAVAFTTLVPTLTPVVTPTIVPVTPIAWTEEDFNALTWLCYEEVRGMREVRYDACLSVISTVRRRYAYDDDPYGEETIEETLLRTNQFPIEFHLDRPAPDTGMVQAVEEYRWGARGSCTGYLYYDSVNGGPSLCVIRGANGQFVEFHDGWK